MRSPWEIEKKVLQQSIPSDAMVYDEFFFLYRGIEEKVNETANCAKNDLFDANLSVMPLKASFICKEANFSVLRNGMHILFMI
jgi:hypothetical protein